MWNLDELYASPNLLPAEGFSGPKGVQSCFYESVSWQGKPTRVFGWWGMPEEAKEHPVPGMVLVHGGGGTAFPEWVEMWVKRGYAALAMDTCGCTSGGEHGSRPRHPDGGPSGWGGFEQIEEPPADQWAYHAVAAVIRGHSLLRSLPGVDSARIGLTGISWGGFLACIAAGVDHRFAFAAPVYGCGFIEDSPAWREPMGKMGEENTRRWCDLWDPANFLPQANLPMLWVNGTNDFAYPLPIYQRSYRLISREQRTLSIGFEMPHSQEAGAAPPEIHDYAEALFRGGEPLPRIVAQGNKSGMGWGTVWVETEAASPHLRAELLWTEDRGEWPPRQWQTHPAQRTDARGGRIRWQASVSSRATAHFLNLVDDTRGLVVSGEHYQAL